MDIKEAEELINKPVEDNYMVISLGFSECLIVPYTAGKEIISALSTAEMYKNSWGSNASVEPISKSLEIKFISAEEYRESKMRYYLQGET